MKPYLPIGLLLSLLFVLCSNSSHAVDEAKSPLFGKRPNIVLIMTDDQGWLHLGSSGHPFLHTPRSDEFAKESLVFNDFVVSSTCAPTRAALMSGAHPFKSGVTHTIHERERMALDMTTLPEVLQSAGYRTGIFGKWHLGDEDEFLPDNRGFDEVFIHGAGGIGQCFPGSGSDIPRIDIGQEGFDPSLPVYFNPLLYHNGDYVQTKGFCTDVFFDEALDWMEEQRDAEKPFFAYLSTNAPHGPFISPGPEYDKFHIDKPQRETLVPFYSMIVNLDENLGKLLDCIDEMGIRENTLVIFMTDNGPVGRGGSKFRGGLVGGKVSVDYGGIRSFAFWRWPEGFKGGTKTDGLAAHIDLLPTFAELAGQELEDKVKQQIDGRSLIPLLDNPAIAIDALPDRTIRFYRGRWNPGELPSADVPPFPWSVRTNRFILVNKDGTPRLFDLKADLGQTTDLAAQHPELVEKLVNENTQWWRDVQPRLVNEEAYQSAPDFPSFATRLIEKYPNKKKEVEQWVRDNIHSPKK